MEKWITRTNIKLKRGGKLLTNDKQMELFLGIFFAVTQEPKKGGIMRAFYVCSDVLFPDPDLGKFVLKHWHFKYFFLIGHMLP